jgi:hypothetical protein
LLSILADKHFSDLDMSTKLLTEIAPAAASGDPEQCGVEAGHIHNLPVSIEHFSEDLLSVIIRSRSGHL